MLTAYIPLSLLPPPLVGRRMSRDGLARLTTGVKERHLETVLPARGGKVIVVRGPEKGATGKLLAKNKEKETALVQVSEWGAGDF